MSPIADGNNGHGGAMSPIADGDNGHGGMPAWSSASFSALKGDGARLEDAALPLNSGTVDEDGHCNLLSANHLRSAIHCSLGLNSGTVEESADCR